jgi:hypothetical protein
MFHLCPKRSKYVPSRVHKSIIGKGTKSGRRKSTITKVYSIGFSNLSDRDKGQSDRSQNEAQQNGENMDDWDYEDNVEVNYEEFSLPLPDDSYEDISDNDCSDKLYECEENDDETNWNIMLLIALMTAEMRIWELTTYLMS